MPTAGYFTLYRAVSPAELADIATYGGFRPIAGSMQGKWFAESAAHASVWGLSLSQFGAGAFHVVQTEVPQAVADQMFRVPLLDQIGPARYAEGDLLDLINQTNLGISEVPLTSGGGP